MNVAKFLELARHEEAVGALVHATVQRMDWHHETLEAALATAGRDCSSKVFGDAYTRLCLLSRLDEVQSSSDDASQGASS